MEEKFVGQIPLCKKEFLWANSKGDKDLDRSVSKKVWELVKDETMDENQIYHLLREMEVVDEQGDFVWEDDPNEDDIWENETEAEKVNQQFNLPEDIIPSIEQIKIDQMGRETSKCSPIKVCTEKRQIEEEGVKDMDQSSELESERYNAARGKNQGANLRKCSKSKWGPVVAERRSTRCSNDTRPWQEKADELIKKKNLEDNYCSKLGGKKSQPSSSNVEKITKIADVVNVNLGEREVAVNENIEKYLLFADKRKKPGSSVGSVPGEEIEKESCEKLNNTNNEERGKHPMKKVNK